MKISDKIVWHVKEAKNGTIPFKRDGWQHLVAYTSTAQGVEGVVREIGV